MNILKSIWNQVQYAKLCRRVNRLPEKQQIQIGQKIYEEAYEVMKLAPGECFGACSVVFQCPYDGHVSYHISKTLEERVADASDPSVFSDVSKLTGNSWVATAVVKSNSEQNAISAADACVMSAVLKSKTVDVTFTKFLSTIETVDGTLPERDVLRASIRKNLGDVAKGATSAFAPVGTA